MFESLLEITRSVVLEYNKTINKDIPKEELVLVSYKDMLGKLEFLFIPINENTILYKVIYDVNNEKINISQYILNGNDVTFDVSYEENYKEKEAEIIEETEKSEE